MASLRDAYQTAKHYIYHHWRRRLLHRRTALERCPSMTDNPLILETPNDNLPHDNSLHNNSPPDDLPHNHTAHNDLPCDETARHDVSCANAPIEALSRVLPVPVHTPPLRVQAPKLPLTSAMATKPTLVCASVVEAFPVNEEPIDNTPATPKGRFTDDGESLFLALPAELRLKVYDYLIPAKRLDLRRIKHEANAWRFCQTTSQIRDEMLHRYARSRPLLIKKAHCYRRDIQPWQGYALRSPLAHLDCRYLVNLTRLAIGLIRVKFCGGIENWFSYRSWGEVREAYWNSHAINAGGGTANGDGEGEGKVSGGKQMFYFTDGDGPNVMPGLAQIMQGLPGLRRLEMDLEVSTSRYAPDTHEMSSQMWMRLSALPRMESVALALNKCEKRRRRPVLSLVRYMLLRFETELVGRDPDAMELPREEVDSWWRRSAEEREEVFDNARTALFGADE